MKKYLLIPIIILCFYSMNAQEYEYVDSLESVQINIKADFDSTYGGINISYLPINNILIDKTLWLIQPERFNGLTISDTLNLNKFYQVYTSIRNSHYIIPNWIYPTDSLKNKAKNYDSSIEPISIIFFEYSKLKQNCFDDSLLYVSNDIIYDVQGRQETPYESDILLAASPLRTVFTRLEIPFILDSTICLFSNLSTQIDSILIDFNDGNGTQSINIGDTLYALYTDNGNYIIKVSVYKNGTEFKSYSTILIHSTSSSNRLSYNLPPDIEFNLTSDIPYQGVAASGKISVYLGCGNHSIKKPFIVLPGFDPFGDQTNKSILSCLNGNNKLPYGCNNGFSEYLVNESGYDLIILHYDNGSDYIQRNAYLAETLINWVNTQLQQNGSDKNITLFGISMGGLVGRYALLDMENKDIDHNVQLYISGDSPHQGANIPYAYQKLVVNYKGTINAISDEVSSQVFGGLGGILFGFIGEFLGELAGDMILGNLADKYVYNKIDDLLNKSFYSPAAKQMLINYIDVYNQNTDYFGPHSIRTQLLNEMSQMGNYPSECRMVAISNGSLNNHKQLNLQPGDKMLAWDHDTYMLRIILDIYTNYHNSTTRQKVLKAFVEYRKIRWYCWFCSLFFMEKVVDINAYIKNAPAIDCTPGGFTNINKRVAGGINSLNFFQSAGYNNKPNISFVPTYSSLGIIKNNPQIDLINGSLSIKDGLANGTLSTPFEEIYDFESGSSTYNENQNHTDFCSVSLYDVMKNEIVGRIIEIDKRTIKTEQDIIYEAEETIKLGNINLSANEHFLVENGAKFRARAGKEIILSNGFVATTGCDFHAKIEPMCYTYYSKINNTATDEPHSSIIVKSTIPEKNQSIAIKVKPNPLFDNAKIQIRIIPNSIINLALYDLLGNKIIEFANNEIANTSQKEYILNSTNIPSGIYTIILQSDNDVISERIAIIK